MFRHWVVEGYLHARYRIFSLANPDLYVLLQEAQQARKPAHSLVVLCTGE